MRWRTTQPKHIANPEGPHAGHYLELVAAGDGSFKVINSRTDFTQKYPAPR